MPKLFRVLYASFMGYAIKVGELAAACLLQALAGCLIAHTRSTAIVLFFHPHNPPSVNSYNAPPPNTQAFESAWAGSLHMPEPLLRTWDDPSYAQFAAHSLLLGSSNNGPPQVCCLGLWHPRGCTQPPTRREIYPRGFSEPCTCVLCSVFCVL